MADERPRWREDFPVRWDEDNYMTRRELAKFLTLGSGLLASVMIMPALPIRSLSRPRRAKVDRGLAARDAWPGGSSSAARSPRYSAGEGHSVACAYVLDG